MTALRARRHPRSLPSDARATHLSREYDDNQLRVEEPLKEILPGQDLASRWADIDDADGSDMECAVALASADVIGEDITMPIIPKRADEFTCSSCFLIHHMSRLASSKDGQLMCTDCA